MYSLFFELSDSANFRQDSLTILRELNLCWIHRRLIGQPGTMHSQFELETVRPEIKEYKIMANQNMGTN